MAHIEEEILKIFPCKNPYRFIDEIISIDENHIVGAYRFTGKEFFFEGHFPGFPVVPGAILSETAAQIGLLAFGMFILSKDIGWMDDKIQKDISSLTGLEQTGLLKDLFYLVSSQMDYRRIVQPGDRIIVFSEKIFFRLGKLKCKVRIETPQKEIVAGGVISGMVNNKKLWQTEL